ncbi:MAG: hypothetical protein IPK79_09730 [Vampirovibrionales bacterium]|nr:hypothetical protein [Vampirovibrionales bacterium]
MPVDALYRSLPAAASRPRPAAALRFGETSAAPSSDASPDASPDAFTRAYETRATSFLACPPAEALAMSTPQTLAILEKRLGADVLRRALTPGESIESPLADAHARERQTDSSAHESGWLAKSHIVGAHPRALGSFWNVVKYAMTLSAAQNAIHLLPVFEQQLNSLYMQNSWRIESEFFDPALAQAHPQLDTPEKQLKATINVLHAMGKAVGFDLMRSSAHYSEMMMAHPDYFPWVQLSEDLSAIARQDNRAHEPAQAVMRGFLQEFGDAGAMDLQALAAIEARMARDGWWTVPADACKGPPPPPDFDLFAPASESNEEARLSALLGPVSCPQLRLARRIAILTRLKDARLFPAPVVDGPPFRPLSLAGLNKDGWPLFEVGALTQRDRGGFSSIFGGMAPYKLYETDDAGRFQIDKPLPAVWAYLKRQAVDLQKAYGFDFIRGDMAHLDYRAAAASQNPAPEALTPEAYDMFSAMKQAVQRENGAPWFAFLPEAMFHIKPHNPDALQHARWMTSDAALGQLQGRSLEGDDFRRSLQWRNQAHAQSNLPICNGMMTADSDNSARAHLYASPRGNLARAFAGLFSPPSYMGMGFEMKGDPAGADSASSAPVDKTAFTHPYNNGLKNKPYQWGKSAETFNGLTRMKRRLEADEHALGKAFQRGVITPLDPHADPRQPVVSWVLKPDGARPEFLFALNTDIERPQNSARIAAGEILDEKATFAFDFSTQAARSPRQARIQRRGRTLVLSRMGPGEGRIYRIRSGPDSLP